MELARTELVRVMELRKGAHVRRYHTERLIGHQSNAEHSHGVAMLFIQFYPHLANSNAIMACLFHDLPEGLVGDMPAPAKWAFPNLYEEYHKAEQERASYLGIRVGLNESEKEAVYNCDLLEAFVFVYEQIKLGNRMLPHAYSSLYSRLSQRILPTQMSELIKQINTEVTLELQ